MDDIYSLYDEGGDGAPDYDPAADFGADADEPDSTSASEKDTGDATPVERTPTGLAPPRPDAATRPVDPAAGAPIVSLPLTWVLSDRVPTQQLLLLLPPPPARRRRARADTERGERPASAATTTTTGGDRPGDRLASAVPVSELLEQLGWAMDGSAAADGSSRWVRPDHSEPYDGSHDATVYRDEDGVERITVYSERQREAWGIAETHSFSTFDLLIQVFAAGDTHLAAAVARLVLADDTPVERLAELLRQGEDEALDTVNARLRAALHGVEEDGPADGSGAPEHRSGARVSTAIVDWEGECIRATDAPNATILIDAGLRIVRRIIVEDDLNPATPIERLYDIEVRLDGKHHIVRDVYSTDLVQPRAWLDRIPGAISDGIIVAPVRTVETEIEAALRARMKLDRPPVHRALRRIGWAVVGDRIGYVTSSGAITSAGPDENLRAVVTGPPAAVSFAEPDPALLADDVRTVLSISSVLSESAKNVLTSLFAAMAWAHSGVTPPGAGLAILGEKGSGKTALVRRILSALSPDPDSLLTSFDSSAGVIGEVGAGAHNSISWVDDARDKPSERMSEEQSVAVDSLLRRTYGGGVAGRSRLRSDGHGRYVRQEPDRSSPMAIITAEKLPYTTTISSLERCLTVELLAKAPDEEPFDDRLKHLLSDGALCRTWGAFVRHLAARIDAEAPGNPEAALTTWRARLKDMCGEMVRDLLASGHLTTRQAEVVAGFIVGWCLWAEFCTEAAALGDGDALAMRDDGQLRLAEAARRHASGIMDPGEVGPMAVVNRLRQAALGEKGWIDGQGFPAPADASRVELLGQVVTERESGKRYVALLHNIAAKAIGMRSGVELVGALGELVARERSGQRTRPTRVRGTIIRAVWIPLDIWNEGDDSGDADHASTRVDDADEDF